MVRCKFELFQFCLIPTYNSWLLSFAYKTWWRAPIEHLTHGLTQDGLCVLAYVILLSELRVGCFESAINSPLNCDD